MSIDQIDSEIRGSLRQITEILGLDRCYIAQFSVSQKGIVCTHCADALGQKQAVTLSEISIPQWVVKKIANRECVIFSHVADLPQEEKQARTYFRSVGTRSHVSLPLEIDGEVFGCMALETTRSEIEWPEGVFRTLKPLTDVFALSIKRKRTRLEYMEKMRFEIQLANLSARFVQMEADEIDEQIDKSLGDIGEFFQSDRCGILEAHTDEKYSKITHAWYDTGIEPVSKDINIALLYPWSYERLVMHGQALKVSNLRELPPEAKKDCESYEAMGIRSSLNIPLHMGKSICHIFVLNNLKRERFWPEEYVSRLRLVGEVFVNALKRKRTEIELKRSYDEIRDLKDKLQVEAEFLRTEIRTCRNMPEIIGQSEALSNVLRLVEQVAPTDTSVLICGETGTGKELIARAIHDISLYCDRTMVKVNCASLPATLVESELFGREKGAYTGALTRQIGRFEMADGSTIFLDEIAELPLELQAKLLRVLQEGTFERLGSPKTIQVHSRVIAATNRNIVEAVKTGKFRQDLFYRLNVFPITVPPLRERVEDIPMLVWAFVNEFCDKMGKQILRIEKRDIEALQRYSWPGNVRELRNVIEHAVIVSTGATLKMHLPQDADKEISWAKTLQEVELRHIIEVLQHTGGRIKGDNGAARILGMIPSTLTSRMKKLGITLRTEKEKGEISS
ncbi:MAG: sigma 54-interacting transcriptional regulator [Geobacteraceae bacterium]|nr:sigma 54-interacting transcriptional regulator [Geobacteraceae bacterium]